jgi:large subunit ribosomal protein L22
MEATAKLRFVRLSPRKTRLVADAIRGKRVEEAARILEFLDNKPSMVLKKVLKSVVANAGNKEGMDKDSLYISCIYIDEGPSWKRFMPRAMGRATPITKKTSHISIVISDGAKPRRIKGVKKAKASPKTEAASKEAKHKKGKASVKGEAKSREKKEAKHKEEAKQE